MFNPKKRKIKHNNLYILIAEVLRTILLYRFGIAFGCAMVLFGNKLLSTDVLDFSTSNMYLGCMMVCALVSAYLVYHHDYLFVDKYVIAYNKRVDEYEAQQRAKMRKDA